MASSCARARATRIPTASIIRSCRPCVKGMSTRRVVDGRRASEVPHEAQALAARAAPTTRSRAARRRRMGAHQLGRSHRHHRLRADAHPRRLRQPRFPCLGRAGAQAQRRPGGQPYPERARAAVLPPGARPRREASPSWRATMRGAWSSGVADSQDRIALRHAKLIVFWGTNPAWTASGGNMWHFLNAKKAGAKVIFVDPYFHQSAQAIADEWIPCRPGTDGALLEALAYEMIVERLQDQEFLDTYCLGFDADHMPADAKTDENFKDYILGAYDGVPKTPEYASAICGTPVETIKNFAREIATTKPMAWKSSGGPGAHLLRQPLRPAVLHRWLDDRQRGRARRRDLSGRLQPQQPAGHAGRRLHGLVRQRRATSTRRTPSAPSPVPAARCRTASSTLTKSTASPSRRRSRPSSTASIPCPGLDGEKKPLRHPLHRARHHPSAGEPAERRHLRRACVPQGDGRVRAGPGPLPGARRASTPT